AVHTTLPRFARKSTDCGYPGGAVAVARAGFPPSRLSTNLQNRLRQAQPERLRGLHSLRFPLTLSPSKGERVLIDRLFRGNDDWRSAGIVGQGRLSQVAAARLLVAQRGDRVEARRFARWVEAEEHTDGSGEEE